MNINFYRANYQKIGSLVVVLLFLLASCGLVVEWWFTEVVPARDGLLPTPTRTDPAVVVRRNQNAQALIAAQQAIGRPPYGFAPLLKLPQSRLLTELAVGGEEVIFLQYPPQGDIPADWLGVDSFVLAYAAQQQLNHVSPVLSAMLGRFSLAAPLDNNDDRVNHFAVWVTFTDGTDAIVDLSPLAPDFGAYHPRSYSVVSPEITHRKFAAWRERIPLNELQPLLIIEDGEVIYYLLAQVAGSREGYRFSMRAYLTQPASHTELLQLTRGSSLEVVLEQAQLAAVQQRLRADGPTAFDNYPHLWQQRGDLSADLTAILEQHLPLLWHLVTKLEP